MPRRDPAAPRLLAWSNRFRIRQYLKGSLWFLPTLGGLVGPLFALTDVSFERRIRVPHELVYSSSSATGLLTAIVGAMVGLLGFVVTIGVLVVQTATGTLSPRFMRLWYRDPLQKAVLATFAGTFTFSFTLLRHIGDEEVPSLGVTGAGVLVTLSLLMLLIYLDRFTHVLRPAAVGALMARYGIKVLTNSFPAPSTLPDERVPPGTGPALVVRSARPGVMQAVHIDGLLAAARRYNCRLELVRTPGDFVAAGAPVIEVNGAGPLPDERALRGLIALGTERTIDQDAAFALRILVDIAIRALSPAVNDPTTAIQMLNHIEIFLDHLARSGPRAGTWVLRDAGGVARLIVPARRFGDYLDLALTEVIAYGAASAQVCRRLRAMLDSLAALIDPLDRPLVNAQVAALEAAIIRSFPDEATRFFARTPDRQGIGGPGTGG